MIEKFSDLKNYVIICTSLKELQDLYKCLLDKRYDINSECFEQTEDKVYFIYLDENDSVFKIRNDIDVENKVLTCQQFKDLIKNKELSTKPFRCDENGRIIEITDINADRFMYKIIFNEGCRYNRKDNDILMTYERNNICYYGKEYHTTTKSGYWRNEECIRNYETVNNQIKKDICFESIEKLYQYMTKVYNELLGNNND